MTDHVYPVHFRRRFEQRWAARFATAAAVKPAKPRKHVAKASPNQTTIEASQIVKKRIDHA